MKNRYIRYFLKAKSIILMLLLPVSMLSVNNLFAQVTNGRVTSMDGKPISDAYIFHLRTGSHIHTNELGLFPTSSYNPGDTLRISSIGYKTDIATVPLNKMINISLHEDVVNISEIMVNAQRENLNFITAIDLKVIPVRSSQELLQKVPGLFIGQHAGGGKAEQLFLRGFDIDHGTDVAISVDGMPVNMVSHAHGQGYADLHFVIPETVEKIDFGKGAYYADKGDFNTAGYVAFQTAESIEKSTIGLSIGDFNTRRLLGMFDLLGKDSKDDAYIASELILTDGPFEASQNFSRINLFGKYTARLQNDSKLSFSASHFTSQWDASGQIPWRLVNDGTISRFGAVDSTEGGNTSRTNVNVQFFKDIGDGSYFKGNAFYSRYTFQLWSNFTFFLEDSINGDQIRQREMRDIYGVNTEWGKEFYLGDWNTLIQAGVGFRADDSKENELSRTRNRTDLLEYIQFGDIFQTNMSGFASARFTKGRWTVNPAIRYDAFEFNYYDRLDTLYNTNVVRKGIASPKLNFIFNQSESLQLYLKTGSGFHSNDTRVVVTDPSLKTLPRSLGGDLGTVWKPSPRIMINAAYWYLYLEQEFVWVGDAGIVEPSGRTERQGVDLGLRYQPNDFLFIDFDINYVLGRSIDEPEGEAYIPLAPDLTSTAGLGLVDWKGFSGSYRIRYMADRPANEDNSIIASGFAVSDISLNYQIKKFTIGFTLENVFDTEWEETQFATESRLQNETESVEEIHFTPGFPRFLRGRLLYNF